MSYNIQVYLPELDYWFSEYWKVRKDVKVTQLNSPETVSSSYFNESGTLFKLLFSEDYEEASYFDKFIDDNILNYPTKVLDKLRSRKEYVHCYTTDSTGTQVFYELEQIDYDILDCLKLYRRDGTSDISTISYDNLSKRLSKLVYIYLDFMLNDNYEKAINLDTEIGDPETVVDALFEFYVINEIHKSLKNNEYILSSNIVNTIAVRKRKYTDSTDVLLGSITFDEPVPINESYCYLYHNGILLNQNDDYNISLDSTSVTISWNSSLEVNENDIFVLDYYSENKNYIVQSTIVSQITNSENEEHRL